MISSKDTLSVEDIKKAVKVLKGSQVKTDEWNNFDYYLVLDKSWKKHRKEVDAWVDKYYTKRGIKVKVVYVGKCNFDKGKLNV